MFAFSVKPLKSVGTKKIPLRLNKIGSAALPPVGIEIAKRTSKCRNRQAI